MKKETKIETRAHQWHNWVILGLSLYKLYLVSGQRLTPAVSGSYDDLSFLLRAIDLLNGAWLGEYTQMTLIKGPFYPLWIAAAFRAGVPLLLSQNLLYIFACLVVVQSLRPLLKRPLYGVLLYALLLFNPLSFQDQVATRVIREAIYPALTLLVMACFTGLALRPADGWRTCPWAAGSGISLAAFWLTREERIWLIPSIALLALLSAWLVWSNRRSRPRFWLLPLLHWSAAFLIFIGLVSSVYTQNREHYGVFATTEFDTPEFKAAYGAITRVKGDEWSPDIPAPRSALKKVFQASPVAAKLEPYLFGPIGASWAKYSTDETRATTHMDEIRGGWFMWALREAVAAYLRGRMETFPADYYLHLARQVNTACDTGKLDCYPPHASLMPPWHDEYRPMLWNNIRKGFRFLVTFEALNAKSEAVVAHPSSQALFETYTREQLYADHLVINGWAYAENGPVSLDVVAEGGIPASANFTNVDSEAAFEYFSTQSPERQLDARRSGFTVSTVCIRNCLLLASNGTITHTLAINPPYPPNQLAKGEGLYLEIESIQHAKDEYENSPAGAVNNRKIATLQRVIAFYQYFSPLFTGLAMVAFIALSLQLVWRRSHLEVWVPCAALLGAMVARLIILALVDVTSFPAIRVEYMSPNYPLLLWFDGLLIFYFLELGIAAWSARRVGQDTLSPASTGPTSPFEEKSG